MIEYTIREHYFYDNIAVPKDTRYYSVTLDSEIYGSPKKAIRESTENNQPPE
jgi:hypothetical protein